MKIFGEVLIVLQVKDLEAVLDNVADEVTAAAVIAASVLLLLVDNHSFS